MPGYVALVVRKIDLYNSAFSPHRLDHPPRVETLELCRSILLHAYILPYLSGAHPGCSTLQPRPGGPLSHAECAMLPHSNPVLCFAAIKTHKRDQDCSTSNPRQGGLLSHGKSLTLAQASYTPHRFAQDTRIRDQDYLIQRRHLYVHA